jgi:hypothetical protein
MKASQSRMQKLQVWIIRSNNQNTCSLENRGKQKSANIKEKTSQTTPITVPLTLPSAITNGISELNVHSSNHTKA